MKMNTHITCISHTHTARCNGHLGAPQAKLCEEGYSRDKKSVAPVGWDYKSEFQDSFQTHREILP
ncbi:hypothetical protein I79_013150 [Cricetulus griseus]|uniref:Uncharacterized protein n=1 Tax=Cricetulus griseus TaxID=10029 RepID=G3HQP5_CRIGR|nr:hypothetical protein I79_013150 [Cricetulus griseus]